jgi:hypothetical protein
MAQYYLIILMLLPISGWAENALTQAIAGSVADVKAAVEDLDESYRQCEALYEQVRNSECANSVFGIFGRMHLKLGVSFTERQLKFQHVESQQDTFILSSGSKPRPIYSIAFSDTYFSDSNWGYGFGFDYFDDYAFNQVIQRNGVENQSFDLGTYSSMSVISVSPSIFYTWGRGDDSPNRYGKFGLGLNAMYSAIKGTAYETELDTADNSTCYEAATNIFNGDPLAIMGSCDLQRFKESSVGFGSKIFIVGGWNKWEAELSVSQFNHPSDGDYRFVTQQVLVGLSRKFSF